LRLLKVDRDPARLQPNTCRKVLEPLINDFRRRLDQQLRSLHPLLPQTVDYLRDLSPALDFVMPLVTFGKASKPQDKVLPFHQSVGADTLAHARSDDLLSASASNTKQEFDGRAIHKRAGKRSKRLYDLI